MQVFRDFYPVSDDFVTLECVWKSDKFILLERKHKMKISPLCDHELILQLY